MCPKWRCHFAATTKVLRIKQFEEVCLQVSAEDRKWRRGCEVLRKTVPDPNGGIRWYWKSSVAVGWESGMGNRRLVRWSGMQTPSKLRLWWKIKFIGEIWRCQAVKTFINKNGQQTKIMPITKKNVPYQQVFSRENEMRLYIISSILEVTLMPMDIV